MYFNFGGLSHGETLKSMERVAKEVMPHFAEHTTAAPARA
jgi:hypothetical protein